MTVNENTERPPETPASPLGGEKPDPGTPLATRWRFTHNACPFFIVSANSEDEAIRVGLLRIGLEDSPHPCKAWPAQPGE